MLTEGVENASTAMHENVKLYLKIEIHVWIKRNAVSIYGSPYFVDVELMQIEKNALYCAMFC